MSVQGESLGPAIEFGPGYETYWAYIPHFIHSPFYVYAYAFGDCLVNSLYGVYQRAEPGFVEKYFALLSAGGSKHYSELLAPFGLDARDPVVLGDRPRHDRGHDRRTGKAVMLFGLFWLVLWTAAAFAALAAFNLLLARLIERLVPPIGQFVDVDGLRLHYVDTGEKPGQDGPPLLFVHGWLGQLNHFSYALAALFPERRVVLVDRPGCGYSQAPRLPTIAANAAVIAAFMDRIGLRRPLVIGHSLGGAIALALALDQPRQDRRARPDRAFHAFSCVAVL